MVSLYEEPGFTICHDIAHRWLHVTWHGPHPGQTAQACCEQILLQVAQTRSVKILNDGSQDLNGWKAVVPWGREVFFQQLAASGVVAFAWVIPRDIRAQTLMNQLITPTKCLLIDTFADVEAAYEWLQEGRPNG